MEQKKPKNKERLDTAQKVAHTGSSILKGIWYVIAIVFLVVIIFAGIRVFSGLSGAITDFFSRFQ